jgi:hypothetical protein
VLTVRTQVTDRMLIFDQRHLRAVLAQYARHDNRRHPVPRAPPPTTPARPPDPHHHTRTDQAPIPPGRPDQRIRTSHLKDQVNAGGHVLASHRYVIPAAAVRRLAAEAAESGGCVDVAAMAAQRRTAREVTRGTGGTPW